MTTSMTSYLYQYIFFIYNIYMYVKDIAVPHMSFDVLQTGKGLSCGGGSLNLLYNVELIEPIFFLSFQWEE